jgi:hypothetical protein
MIVTGPGSITPSNIPPHPHPSLKNPRTPINGTQRTREPYHSMSSPRDPSLVDYCLFIYSFIILLIILLNNLSVFSLLLWIDHLVYHPPPHTISIYLNQSNPSISRNSPYSYWIRDHPVSTPAAVPAAYSASPSDTAHSHGLASSGTRVDRTPGRTNVAPESAKSNGKTRGLRHESRGQYHSNTVISGSVIIMLRSCWDDGRDDILRSCWTWRWNDA